jgi:hypothetical protein
MLLWNALMPRIFDLLELDYLQAIGLLILTRILFGGIGGQWHGRRGVREDVTGHGNKLREKWMNMSEEERKEFIEKEKDFFKSQRRFSRMRDFLDDDEEQNTDTGTKKDSSDE